MFCCFFWTADAFVVDENRQSADRVVVKSFDGQIGGGKLFLQSLLNSGDFVLTSVVGNEGVANEQVVRIHPSSVKIWALIFALSQSPGCRTILQIISINHPERVANGRFNFFVLRFDGENALVLCMSFSIFFHF